ncbi:MAG: hypothetical protein JSU05_08235 [Bacteroidetes bacterium]|nr:hypothetical protein [Bacteroidota bacterium]
MKVIPLLLKHQWLSFWRSRNSGKSLGMQIFIGFITLYLMAVSLAAGLAMPKLIEKAAPGRNVTEVFAGFVLYYFSFDILMRFMMQELPTLTIQPYLTKNIRRKQLVQFLNLRSLFHFFNILPLFLFLPFSFLQISTQYGGMAASSFIFSILGLVIFNHFIILYIKRKTILSNWWMVGFFVTVVAVAFCDYKGWISISHFSSAIFMKLLQNPWLTAVPLLMAFFAFINNNRFLYKNLYVEEMVKSGSKKSSAEYTWLNRFGEEGELMSLDFKLILRNKRSRSVLMLSAIFLFYGFLFYKKPEIEANHLGMLLVGAIFITGIFIINYGNFLFAWQSSHFDGLLTSRLKLRTYIKSKLTLFLVISSVSFVVTCFYGLISWKLLVIQLAAYLFNIGVISVMSVYMATFNYKRLELERSASFNYQGTGAAQWLYALLILLLPFVIYFPFSFLFNNWAGIAALGITGLTSLLLRDWWTDFLVKQFLKRKYLILEGFREK